MTLSQVMSALAARGTDSYKRTMLRHGAKEPFFGVKISDMKLIHKKIKGDQPLALALYATGNGDAQYLAGMVADGGKMTRAQVQQWLDTACWSMISGNTVPWIVAEHPEGLAIALEWIDSPQTKIADAGWKSLCGLVATLPDEQLPIARLSALLDRVVKTIASSDDDICYAMNNFVIACGTYVAPLGAKAIATARRLGKVEIDMGDTACKVPDAESYIIKSRRGAAVAPKRKTMRC